MADSESTPSPEESAQGPVGSTSGTPEYEFSARENEIIGNLASKLFFVGLFMLVIAVLVIVQGLVKHEVGHVIFALIYLCIGSLLVVAASSFKDVVRTRGRDITLLMDALDKLRWIYTIQCWFILIAIILMVILLSSAPAAR